MQHHVKIVAEAAVRQPTDALKQQRFAQRDGVLRYGGLGNDLRQRDPNVGNRQRDNQACQRPRRGDVEQRAPVGDAWRHLNDGAERAEQ